MSIDEGTDIILNESFFQSLVEICKVTGSLDKYIRSRETLEELLNSKMFRAGNQEIFLLLLAYLHYFYIKLTPPNGKKIPDECYKVKAEIDADTSLSNYLRKYISEDRLIYYIFSLCTLYHFIKTKNLHLIVEQKGEYAKSRV
jgi:hypothetical protein